MRLGAAFFAFMAIGMAADLKVVSPPGVKPVGPYSPGILAGFLLAALGHATRERLVAWLGLLVLVGAVFFFCCDYDLVLSARAGLLVASGLVLLGARFSLWRWTAKEGTP